MAKQKKPRMVLQTVDIEEDIKSMSYATLAHAAKVIESLRVKYGDDATVTIDVESGWGDNPYLSATLRYERPETEEERKNRLSRSKERREREKEVKAALEEEERKLFEQLRQKYGQ